MSIRSRVPKHTRQETNQRIHEETLRSVHYYASHPEQIGQRLRELEDEWDIESVMERNSSVISLAGLLLGFTVNRRWFLLPLAIQGFFLQHAVQGWCPPLPLLRRMGMRTIDEIDYEKYALKALRGDFEGKSSGQGETLSGTRPTAAEIVDAVMH